jgi:hypothetical protein
MSKSSTKNTTSRKSTKATKGSVGFIHGGTFRQGLFRIFKSDEKDPADTLAEFHEYYGQKLSGRYVNVESVDDIYEKFLEHYEKEHSDLSKTDIAMLNNLRGWFLSSDHEFLKTVSELMLSHMHMLHDNIIFFPCFSESFDCAKYNFPKDQCMYNYVLRARTLLNLPTENWDMKTEVSKNIAQHLTPEFNDFVAEVLYNKITTGVWDFSKLENVKLQHTKEQYYIL